MRRCLHDGDDDPRGLLDQPPPEVNDPVRRMVWNYSSGVAALLLGRPAIAHPAFLRSLAQARRLSDLIWEGRALAGLGAVLGDIGEYDVALARLEQSLKISRLVGDAEGKASALTNLGTVFTRIPGCALRAPEWFQEGHARYLEASNPRAAAATLGNLAEVLIRIAHDATDPTVGDPDPGVARLHTALASRAARQAARDGDAAGIKRVGIHGRLIVAFAAAVDGHLGRSELFLNEAADLLTEYSLPSLETLANLVRGCLQRRMGQCQEGLIQLCQALVQTEQSGARHHRVLVQRELILAHEASGDFRSALRTLRQYHQEQSEQRDAVVERQALLLRARLSLRRAELAEAVQRQRADLLARQKSELADASIPQVRKGTSQVRPRHDAPGATPRLAEMETPRHRPTAQPDHEDEFRRLSTGL